MKVAGSTLLALRGVGGCHISREKALRITLEWPLSKTKVLLDPIFILYNFMKWINFNSLWPRLLDEKPKVS